MLKYKIPQVVTLTHDWEQFGNISDKKKNAEKRHNYTVFQYVIILLNFNPS